MIDFNIRNFTKIPVNIRENNNISNYYIKKEIIFSKNEIEKILEQGSSEKIVNFIFYLMDDEVDDSSVSMWLERSFYLLSSLVYVLVYMRNKKEIILDVDIIREYLILKNIQKLAQRKDLSDNLLKELRCYLKSLPFYQENVSIEKQKEVTLENHGFIQMQFIKVLHCCYDVVESNGQRVLSIEYV